MPPAPPTPPPPAPRPPACRNRPGRALKWWPWCRRGRCPGSACCCRPACRSAQASKRHACARRSKVCSKTGCSTMSANCTLPSSLARRSAKRCGWRYVTATGCARTCKLWRPPAAASRAWCPRLPPAPPPPPPPNPPPARPRGVRAEPAVAALAERTLGQSAGLYTASQRALDAARSHWDLAQFDLASSGSRRAMRKAGSTLSAWLYAPRWRAARWGAGLLALTQLAGLNVWAWHERQTLAAKQAAVHAVLTQTFAQVQVVANAPVQMENELARLRQAAGSVSASDLEPMLAAADAALPAGRLPSAIEYSPGALRLRGLALVPDEASALSGRLQAAGYQASVEDGNLWLRTQASP